jgi:hypothetical protein
LQYRALAVISRCPLELRALPVMHAPLEAGQGDRANRPDRDTRGRMGPIFFFFGEWHGRGDSHPSLDAPAGR